MKYSNLNSDLSAIDSFDKFEKFKLETAILEQLDREVIDLHKLPSAALQLFSEGTNIVFAYGENKVIKIFPPFHSDQFQRELLVLKHLQGRVKVNIPQVAHHGEIHGWPYIIMSRLQGEILEGMWENLDQENKIIIIQELGALIAQVHLLETNGLEKIDCNWKEFITNQIKSCAKNHQSNKLAPALVSQIPDYIAAVKEDLLTIEKPVILTGEYTPMNFLVKQKNGIWHIDGLIDFGDAMLGRAEYDLLGPGLFLIQGDKQLLKEFLAAYKYNLGSLPPKFSHQLTALMLLHQYSNLPVQIRIDGWEKRISTLEDLENLLWGLED